MATDEKKAKLAHPPDLDLGSNSPSCLSFHQSEDILAVATFDGDLRLYEYSEEENKLGHSVTLKEGTICREVEYTVDGDKILLACCNGDQNDLLVYDINDGGLKLERTIKKATTAAVSSLYSIDENVFATGDDDGNVMLWDHRSKGSFASLKSTEDCVTSMISNSDKKILACTAADGTLFAIKIRGGSIHTESEVYDSEFNCIGLFKEESKLAVGSGDGSVYVFNWDEFGKHSDIYTGGKSKSAINTLIPITEEIIITGDEDGNIRAVNFFPHKYLGLVGKVPYSIEKMDVSNDGHIIATLGSDEEVIKFWNISYLEGMGVSSDEKLKHKSKPPRDDETKSNLPSSKLQNVADFYQGLGDEDK